MQEENAMKIDLQGHCIDPDMIEKELLRRQEINAKIAKDVGFKMPPSFGCECYHCGRHVGFVLREGESDPVIDFLSDWREPDADRERKLVELDPSTRCPMETLGTITLPFTSKSGRVALANDLREYVPDTRAWYSINHIAGKIHYMEWYAKHGYLTARASDTSTLFVPKDDGLDMMVLHGGIDEPLHEPLYKSAVADVDTELWWFAIMDADDLPEGATDSYDRPITFYDLPEGPGEYEMTVDMSLLVQEAEAVEVIASLRKVV